MFQFRNTNIKVLNEVLYGYGIFALLIEEEVKIDFFPEISLPFIALFSLSSLSVISAKYPELCVYEIIEIFKMF